MDVGIDEPSAQPNLFIISLQHDTHDDTTRIMAGEFDSLRPGISTNYRIDVSRWLIRRDEAILTLECP